jgi:hypothetical protein
VQASLPRRKRRRHRAVPCLVEGMSASNQRSNACRESAKSVSRIGSVYCPVTVEARALRSLSATAVASLRMNQNPYIAGSRLAVETSWLRSADAVSSARSCFYSDFLYGGEGGITRRCAPRPFGAALRALSPRCRCHSKLNENVENLLHAWRRGRDSNPRWAFDSTEDS